MSSYAFMYNTRSIFLGQVGVTLSGSGVYNVDCCTHTFAEWFIEIKGFFSDVFDELIPVPGPKKGVGSLPLSFVGEWKESHSFSGGMSGAW